MADPNVPPGSPTPRIEDSSVESHPFKAHWHGREDGTPGYLAVESGYIVPGGFFGGFEAILPKFAGTDLQDQRHTSDLTHITDPAVGDYYVEATGEWRTTGFDGDNKIEMYEPHTAEIKHHSQLDLTHEKKRALKLFKLESDGRVSQYIKSDIPMNFGRTTPAIPPWEEPPSGSDSDSGSSSSSSSSGSGGSWSAWGSDSGSAPYKWATFHDDFFPEVIYPGVTSNVQVQMRNDGTLPWEVSDQLIPMEYDWGLFSVPVPVTYPGVVRDFNFEIVAPMTPGVYQFSWQLYGGGVYYGEQTPVRDIEVVVPGSGGPGSSDSSSGPPTYLDAAFVNWLIFLEELETEHIYPFQITMRNIGTETWYPGVHKLIPTAHDWGMFEVAVPTVTPPGVERTFDMDLTAPATPGVYDIQFQMYGPEGPFGAPTPHDEIPVVPWVPPIIPPDSGGPSSGSGSEPYDPGSGPTPAGDDAVFVFQQDVPPEITQGSTADVQVTFRNIGTTLWAIPTHRLVSKVPDANTFWGASEFPAGMPTYVGGERTFYLTITAPETTGLVPFRMQMHTTVGDLFFGNLTPPVNILVVPRSSDSSSSA